MACSPRSAQAVHGIGGNVRWQSDGHGNPACIICICPDLADTSRNDFGNILSVDLSAFQRGLRSGCAELVAGNVLADAPETAGWRSGTIQNDDFPQQTSDAE